MRSKKQSLLVEPDLGYEGSSTRQTRSSSVPKIGTASTLAQRRSPTSASVSVRQMNIIKEDKEENNSRKEY